MDMTLVSAITAQQTSTLRTQVGVSVMKKSMDATKESAALLLSAMSPATMEKSVTPWKGGSVDVRV